MNEYICRYGIMSAFEDNDLVSRSLKTYGEWAQREIDVLRELISEGDTVIDVGAFIGTHTLAFADKVGDTGKIIAFEPNPSAFVLLEKNVARLNLPSVKIHNEAVGDKIGSILLATDDQNNIGTSHISDNSTKGITACITTLDNLHIANVNFIKIDVEGYEKHVLIGSLDTIHRCRPVLFLEVNTLSSGVDHIEWSKKHNYLTCGVLVNAYNDQNFLKEEENIFGLARECGLVLIPNEKLCEYKSEKFIPINTVDDIALMLLHKPQYVYEVLAKADSAAALGLNFPSPLSDSLTLEVRNRAERIDVITEELESTKLESKNRAERIDVITEELESIKYDFSKVLNSRSWRITKPIRDIRKFTRITKKITTRLNHKNALRAIQLARQGNWGGIYRRIGRVAVNSLNENLDTGINSTESKSKKIFWPDLSACIDISGFQPKNHISVTIVIPVYNGFDYLQIFFDSVYKNTTEPYDLVVINDASTDERVAPFLQGQKERFSHMSLLQNDTNQGFVRSVNRGMQKATHDVVLLNTDTVVPPCWLERLVAPLSDDTIASVTPFTNAGTICSFPTVLQDNTLVYGLSSEEIDAAFNHLLYKGISIPTAVGFCMAISHKALDKVGYFDAETFGRGYGEENDWCMRAIHSGYQHVLCSNLFVYHAHGGSFLPEEKQALLVNNLSVIDRRYPEYGNLVQRHIQDDPAKFYRETARLLLMLRLENRPAMVIDHARGGGANNFRARLVQKFIDAGRSVCVYTDDYLTGVRNVTCYFNDDSLTFDFNSLNELSEFLHIFSFEDVYYNSLVFADNPLAVVDMLCGIPAHTSITVYMHDFYPVCPSYTLLNDGDEFCGIPEITLCSSCIRKHKDVFPNAVKNIEVWREHWQKLFDRSQAVVCFSSDTGNHLTRAYPDCADKIVITPHDMSYFVQGHIKPSFSEPLHIGIIGAINKQKGATIIQRFASHIKKNNLPCRITVVGEIDPNYSMPDNVILAGTYTTENLRNIIMERGIQIIWFPSIWPETFSYVTSECMLMGLPITSFDIGAQAERLKTYQNSFFHTSKNPEDLFDDFIWFKDKLAAEYEQPRLSVERTGFGTTRIE